MANCIDCGHKLGGLLGRHDIGGICPVCDSARHEAARQPALAAELAENAATRAAIVQMFATTETAPVGIEVAARLGIVSADVAFGQNLFKDAALELRDFFGGRSATMSKTLREGRAVAIDEMKREAYALGANAVVGVVVNITSVGASSMMLVSATGTAVTLQAR